MTAPDPPDKTTPATILIVDDEGQNRRLLEALLGHEGYLTRTARNGEEALAAIADDPPDLILLDVMMPGLDGREVARAVKADAATRSIPIIMVTAQTDREARLAALDAGAEDILSKPVDRAELWLRVRNLLRLKRLSDLLENHQVTLEAEAQARTAELQARTVDLRRFRTAMDAADDSIVLVNRTTMLFVAVNASASQMLGYSREELLELGPMDLVPASRDQLEALYDEVIAGRGRNASLETTYRRDGSALPVEVHRQAQRAGADWIIVSVTRDITERLKTEARLQDLAQFDALTGLLNRALFCETLTKTLEFASATGESVAVLHLDLDYFKDVNQTLGHGLGDEVLVQVSDRLIESLRDRDTVGRLGGDEFALILTMLEGRRDAALVARKVQRALLEPFRLDGRDVTVTASIGITMHPDDATDTETLLRCAETAMHQAKQSGRDAFQFFTSAMNTEVWRRLELETALRSAVSNGEFVLHYQPKVELKGGHVVGLEALLRWDRPGFGLVPPSEFIYSLEESGLIVDVGRWVIAAACEQIREWSRRGIDPVQVSVNVSERQLVRGDLQGDVFLALDTYEVPARLLELEVTESLLMTSTDRTIAILQNLKDAGVQISIDDFGTGQSNLEYLRRFPIDKLKIDRRFIHEVTRSSDAAAAALAIIRLGHSLDLEVIAAGVETEPQLAYLRGNECDQIQGNYFNPPLEVPALDLLLMARTDLTAPDD
jgi:diguanylate cyclase (GGDEF)-like protein/PAS domain S-box-containing protein